MVTSVIRWIVRLLINIHPIGHSAVGWIMYYFFKKTGVILNLLQDLITQYSFYHLKQKTYEETHSIYSDCGYDLFVL